jgi:hypothetical protein
MIILKMRELAASSDVARPVRTDETSVSAPMQRHPRTE